MLINFFTLNLGDSRDSEQWPFFFKEFLNSHITNEDLWVFCTQEDLPKSMFMGALRTHIGDKFNIYEHSSYSCRKDFNIKMMIITNKENKEQIIFKSPYYISIEDWITKALRKCDKISVTEIPNCIKRFVSYKAAIYIPIIYDGIPITFVGTHFPFNSKDEFDDACIRKKTLKDIKNKFELETKIEPKIAFIMGDLNFRMKNEKDQLTTILQAQTLGNLNNATNIKNLSPTCKTLTENEKTPLLRESELNNKYDYSRTPSYCDRVLYQNNSSEYTITPTKSEVITIPPINKSDHDGVYVQVELLKTNIGGKNRIRKI